MKNKMKSTKGITLIALIVTIIVLLILAGISINLLIGENGIITRAKDVAVEQAVGQRKEAVALAVTAEFAKNQGDKSKMTVEGVLEELRTALNSNAIYAKKGNSEIRELTGETPIDGAVRFYFPKEINGGANKEIVVTIDESLNITGASASEVANNNNNNNNNDDNNTVNYEGLTTAETYALPNNMLVLTEEQIELSVNAMTSELSSAEIAARIAALEDKTKIKAVLTGNIPVPKGFYYKEGVSTTVSGLTGDAAKNYGVVITDDANLGDSGNEWVWIPVNSTESIDPSDLYVELNDGVNIGATTKKEKDVEFADKINGLRIAAVEGLNQLMVASSSSSSSEEEVEILTETKAYKRSATILGDDYSRGTPNDTSTYREPAIVGRYDGEYYNQAGFSSVSEMADYFVTDYNNMIASIAKYGGFYVGRYELSGTNNGSAAQIESPKVAKDQTQIDSVNWYRLYEACRTFDTTYVTSTMMWGMQWDVMCLYCSESGQGISYSTADASRHSESSSTKTGMNENDRRNNIYDVEGSRREWTQEADGTCDRVLRGGFCSAYYLVEPICRHNVDPGFYVDDIGSRPTLYIR